jgi:hypothetical protein
MDLGAGRLYAWGKTGLQLGVTEKPGGVRKFNGVTTFLTTLNF